MKKSASLAVILVGALFLAAPTAANAAQFAGKKCTNGQKIKVNGKTAYKYCGPAKVSLTVGSTAAKFTQGRCKYSKKTSYWSFALGVGETAAKPTRKFINLTVVGSKPTAGSTYTSGSGVINIPPRSYLTTDLSFVFKTASSGSFTGKAPEGLAISGTFRCS